MSRMAMVINRLETEYGKAMPPPRDPWSLILWENVAYLAKASRRLCGACPVAEQLLAGDVVFVTAKGAGSAEEKRRGVITGSSNPRQPLEQARRAFPHRFGCRPGIEV